MMKIFETDKRYINAKTVLIEYINMRLDELSMSVEVMRCIAIGEANPESGYVQCLFYVWDRKKCQMFMCELTMHLHVNIDKICGLLGCDKFRTYIKPISGEPDAPESN